MYSHAPQDYICPICLGIHGTENEHTYIKKEDLVYHDELVTVFINSFWVGINEGHVIVVPNEHYENLYELPSNIGHRIFDITQKLAVVLKKAYSCDGITIRQNNEPASRQHAFHYHQHIFPRYENDNFEQRFLEPKNLIDPVQRAQFAKILKEELNK